MNALVAYDGSADFPSSSTQAWSPQISRTGLTEGEIDRSVREFAHSSVFSHSRTNPHLFEIRAKLQELIGLPSGWDGHGGKPVDVDIASFAFQLLSATLDANCPAPQVVPLSYGGVQFEWHERNIDLEIEIEAPNEVFLSFQDHETGEELEAEISTDYSNVASTLSLLSHRRT